MQGETSSETIIYFSILSNRKLGKVYSKYKKFGGKGLTVEEKTQIKGKEITGTH